MVWTKEMALSEQESKSEFRKEVANGEWKTKKKEFFPTDEELQFIFGDNWEEEKRKMIEEAKETISRK